MNVPEPAKRPNCDAPLGAWDRAPAPVDRTARPLRPPSGGCLEQAEGVQRLGVAGLSIFRSSRYMDSVSDPRFKR